MIKKECFNKCQYLTNFIISRASILNFEESAFNNCINLKLIIHNELSFVTFGSNAFRGYSNINNFDIKFRQSFDACSYYKQIKVLKKGKTCNLLLLKKKGTDEMFVAKQLLEKEKYETFRYC